jgi:hypothetical protein
MINIINGNWSKKTLSIQRGVDIDVDFFISVCGIQSCQLLMFCQHMMDDGCNRKCIKHLMD